MPFDDGPAALLVFDGTHADVRPSPEPYLGQVPEPRLSRTLATSPPEPCPRRTSKRSIWGTSGPSSSCRPWTTPGATSAAAPPSNTGRCARRTGEAVHATFGPRGDSGRRRRRRAEQHAPDGPWTPSVWSASRGLRKDPIHRDTLGPKGHVPEEFLAFGRVEAGRARPVPHPAHRAGGTRRRGWPSAPAPRRPSGWTATNSRSTTRATPPSRCHRSRPASTRWSCSWSPTRSSTCGPTSAWWPTPPTRPGPSGSPARWRRPCPPARPS